ncbi:MAG: hypothetical protein NVS1B1_10440 [Candidatus Limnocylindrales bacterium]
MGNSSRRSQATPSSRRIASAVAAGVAERFDRSTRRVQSVLSLPAAAITPFRPAIRIGANALVAIIVVSLPFVATAAAQPAAEASAPAVASALDAGVPNTDRVADAPRAQVEARGGTITAGRNPLTVAAEGIRPILTYTLSSADSLSSLSNFFGVSPEAIAYANGVTDPAKLEAGKQISIPPVEGALYTVVAGDTVGSIATHFKVAPDVISTYNRLDFEPLPAPGQRILVPGAALPALVYQTADPEMAEAEKPTVIARATTPAPAQRGGTLAWPVNGVITQYFWSGHTGVDIAAPYGSGLASSIDGVVSATGWVAVGGLRVCISSGGLEECYYHTGAVFVSPGQRVAKGQIVASIGMTGVTTGPHVHWETKINGVFQNPLAVIW